VSGVKSVDASGLKVNFLARDKMRRPHEYIKLSDEQIEEAVRDAFFYDPRVFSFDPEIDVNGDVVTLTGEVEDLAAKRAAEEDALNTIGVWRVRNLLRVRPVNRPDDDVLTDQARDALKRDPYVERHEVVVTVINGKVYLYGKVDSLFERSRAGHVVSGIQGVIDISNNIEIAKRWTMLDDWTIEQNIERQLFWGPFVDADEVTVTVENGAATLTGKVDSWFERRMATKNARDGGAKIVQNQLKVKNWNPSPWRVW